MSKILIIEDEEAIADLEKDYLELSGFEVEIACQGGEGLKRALEEDFDLVILDLMLPEIDGLSILRSLRRNKISVPVILTTALDAVSDRIDGLDAGADDYLVKPYDTEELLARIRALTRRPRSYLESGSTLSHKDIVLDPDTRTLSLTASAGKTSDQIQLSKREVLLMEFFLRNPEKTLNREQLFTRVWGPDGTVEDGNLDTYIYFCRKHLKNLKSRVQILTVHGTGYRME